MTENKPVLLIVEDDLGLQSQLRWHFDKYEVVVAPDRNSAIAAIRMHEPAVVLQDLGLPPDEEGVEEGFATIQETLRIAPNTKIIVVTGYHDYSNALRAVAMGAYDFYQKPVNTDTLDLIVQRAYQMWELEQENRRLQDNSQNALPGVIASDDRMASICRIIEKIAPTDVTCLILGESGTGKEVIARAVHTLSSRNDKRFVAINCAAVPENLMESELFGYEKGAFTGATKRTLGKVEVASGGTLFLDEIGDMPLALQAKLLRFLQERVVERLGGREEIPVDVRVVCATNKNLEQMVAEGTFREDLFYRISEMVIDLPPLRDRGGDKALLARHLLAKFCDQLNKNIKGFTPEAITAIEGYEWPGNIREMENKLKRAVIMCDQKNVGLLDLGLPQHDDLSLNLRTVRQEAEKAAIIRAINMSDGNISAAAKLLGVTRPTLYDLIKKYGIHIQEI
ncbi:MAG: PEP-CTERM-box response regulator transcription factor [Alcanivorax sp.]|jgi:two-component system, NtrC family, response regulator|uniref:PEP-CTERM-box response regulator transcription factor n=1 Tax=unclassified Ketobacter TaxID=2639109 RepID=UPI000E83A0D4|nr:MULTISPECIES: PEP-CTERM-box response regulator transcription factor [unclassified Ketobacter]TNC90992.1 MAG: PEP-CTERM-box response regulator transcription factor [Alcanivorax sp.]HAG94798.1 PEP-CTERM-box response regulator transcription factor [Gammaproteobacteria bacterium]RLT90099.1 MAG: PEP-CTERM-box response regulator transcription factor [Ketobacter sp. GenoA1]RLT99110.1 MAG: PEP-CTERM-box response regulator transcription factor [Ketobacter sp.]HAU12945.1 PEP-CTERM-box response regula|tara:strand:+ start:72415 stop:73770 length:1356 start_codon:yes stop_codon:yes gene_type:complete